MQVMKSLFHLLEGICPERIGCFLCATSNFLALGGRLLELPQLSKLLLELLDSLNAGI